MVKISSRVRVHRLKGEMEIGGALLRDFALLVWSDSGVDEQVLRFCFERGVYKGLKTSTLEQECYILADWLNWLAARNKTLEDALPSDYHRWGNRGNRGQSLSATRAYRKKELIWQFYKGLRSDPALAQTTAAFFETLSEANITDQGLIHWSMKLEYKVGRRSRAPRVPTDEEVGRILSELGNYDDPFLSERNFLIGQVEARIGLRAMGVESLKIETLDKMLESAGIDFEAQSIGNLYQAKSEQIRIRRQLNGLLERGRTVIPAPIVEKGGKKREVEVPIDLAIRLLNHVWGRRQTLITNRIGAKRRNEGQIFLSWRNGGPLSRGSIKDLVSAAFESANVKGSGHALRAYYLTSKAIALIIEARRTFGANYSLEDILNELARLAGHNHRETLRAYLDLARIREAALRELHQ